MKKAFWIGTAIALGLGVIAVRVVRNALSPLLGYGWYGVAATAATAVLTFGLMTGCTSSDVHTVKKAADQISIGLSGIEQLNENLYAAHAIDGHASASISLIVQQAVEANEAFIATARSTSAITPTSKMVLLSRLQVVVDQVGMLNQAGVLHIKSAAGVAAFRAGVATVNASLGIIEGVIGALEAPLPASPSAAPLATPLPASAHLVLLLRAA